MTRRGFLQLGTAASAMWLSGCSARSLPLRLTESPGEPSPLSGLADSLREEHDYTARVSGRIPADLVGTLYRNGPGLFDRGGLRKRNLFDGDGMIQAFGIRGADGGVRFRNKFVRTKKFVDEQAAGRFLYATWCTQAPGGVLANLFGRSMANQAGVTVMVRSGRLYAFDETAQPYELNPETLETIGLSLLGLPAGAATYAAHSKIDPETGDWIHFGLEYGRRLTLHVTIFDSANALKVHRSMPLPRYVYMHDFFVTRNHVLFHLQPAEISMIGFLLGQRSLTDSFRWRPEEGSLLFVLPRDLQGEPVLLETDATWMWHTLNAYARGGEIVADFVGYLEPDHFLGPNAQFHLLMEGRSRIAKSPGEIRRYVIDLTGKKVRQEVLNGAKHEFPFMNPRLRCSEHRFGYFASARDEDAYFTGIDRFDLVTGSAEGYRFDEGQYCSEPVFAGKPGHAYEPKSSDEPGWLFTELYDSRTRKSSLAVLRADALSSGPIATVSLEHHVPNSLHGWWQEAPA